MMSEKRKRKGGRILVVDDEPDIASLLKITLVVLCIVILDITMPSMDGFDLYQ
jgi:DNA-binding response OmpR family regulator